MSNFENKPKAHGLNYLAISEFSSWGVFGSQAGYLIQMLAGAFTQQ